MGSVAPPNLSTFSIVTLGPRGGRLLSVSLAQPVGHQALPCMYKDLYDTDLCNHNCTTIFTPVRPCPHWACRRP